MPLKTFEKRLYRRKAAILTAAGNPIRLAIIEFLSGGEQCVCDIVRCVGARRSNVSRHLGVLRKAGIVQSRKEGLRIIYSLKVPCIVEFLSCVTAALDEQCD